MSLYLINRAMWIALVAALVGALLALNSYDRDVEQAALEDYCESVALWSAEAERGVPLNRRTGHPDYDEIAAEACPGMRQAQQDERQLARN